YGERNTRLARHLDDARDVGRIHPPRDGERPAVETAVEGCPRGVVLRVAGRDDLARDGGAQPPQHVGIRMEGRAVARESSPAEGSRCPAVQATPGSTGNSKT